MASLLLRATLLLVVGAALGVAFNAARPRGLALVPYRAPTECSGGEAAHLLEQLTPAAAAALCGQPSVVIADARSAAAYAEGHIAGAMHLPCGAAGRDTDDALAHFDRAPTILVYGDSTDDGRRVAASLQRRHPTAKVGLIVGGFGAWSQAGLACASGACAECKPGDHP